MSKATGLFEHMQRYTREVFAECLRKEGFSSYKGQDIHWYRIMNNEVIQAIYFVARDSAPCTFAEIMYGCHPLFVPPVLQKSPLMNRMPDYLQISNLVPANTTDGVERFLLYSQYNNQPYRVPDALIMCSPDQNNGLNVLEKLLTILNRTTTAPQCYELHKELSWKLSTSDFRIRSSYFVDEVLYWEDKKLYSFCEEFVKSEAQHLEYAIKNEIRLPKTYRQSWEQGKVLKQVFENSSFEEYLHNLQERAQQNLRSVKRNTGI